MEAELHIATDAVTKAIVVMRATVRSGFGFRPRSYAG
jgi:hypothetical protein